MEIWKEVKNYEGKYEVSNKGRVKSLERAVNCKGGKTKLNKEKILKNKTNGRNQICVDMFSGNGNPKRLYVSILMAIAFLGHKYPNKKKLVVDHKDNNPKNNDINNLQIITHRLNTSKYRKGTSKYPGVCWDSGNRKWKASLQINGRSKNLGHFEDEKEASLYYQNAVKAANEGKDVIVKRRKTSSKYKGVCFIKESKKWASSIVYKGNKFYLGRFNNEYEAHLAYQNKLKELQNG